jgi:hypothetical protein
MDAKPMIDALNNCSAKQLGTKAHLLSGFFFTPIIAWTEIRKLHSRSSTNWSEKILVIRLHRWRHTEIGNRKGMTTQT